MASAIILKNRFCYNYKPTINDKPYCRSNDTLNSNVSESSYISSVIFNNTGNSQNSLLYANSSINKQQINSTILNSTIQYSITNEAIIVSTLQSQLAQITQDRAAIYQPYIYPVQDPSLCGKLKNATANVGIALPYFTVLNCKGSQFTTK
jgi:hypothetical protein